MSTAGAVLVVLAMGVAVLAPRVPLAAPLLLLAGLLCYVLGAPGLP